MGEEKRHQMMQNLFGDQSEEEEDEEEDDDDDDDDDVDSEHESNPHPPPNDPQLPIPDDDDEVDQPPDDDHHHSAAVRNVFGDSDDEPEDHYALQTHPRSPVEEEEEEAQEHEEVVVVEAREEEEEEEEEVDVEEVDEDERSFGKSPRLVDHDEPVPDEDDHPRFDSEEEEENVQVKIKDKPVGPPLELEIPLRPPPAFPQKMNMIKVSNIMGIDPKPFDPKTYVEEDTFVTDESGSKKRIRLENNIVRWRNVRNPDGTLSRESNARFVRWSDGSLQLLIGNEVLDITVQDAQHDQAHLFLRHQKGILQSQGRILRKMRFIPSSLSSNSHRLLTALVDSRHKKVYKVKNCVTDIDPEREKEEKEKAESQTIRSNLLLSRKREKVSRKYTPTVDRRRQLSPGFLEDALNEEDETDYYDSRRSRHRFDEDLEVEARAEKRILNAKKPQGGRDIPRKSSMSVGKSSHRPVDFSESDRGESEYETDGEEEEEEEMSLLRRRNGEPEQEYEEEEDEAEDHEEAERDDISEEEAEEPKQRGKEPGHSLKRKGIESDEESPPRKASTHRRMAVVFDSDED